MRVPDLINYRSSTNQHVNQVTQFILIQTSSISIAIPDKSISCPALIPWILDDTKVLTGTLVPAAPLLYITTLELLR